MSPQSHSPPWSWGPPTRPTVPCRLLWGARKEEEAALSQGDEEKARVWVEHSHGCAARGMSHGGCICGGGADAGEAFAELERGRHGLSKP